MRRLIKPLGALLTVAAATSLSSCNTFDRHDVAASVNGHELTFQQLDALSGGSTSASLQRQTISRWIQIAAPTDGPLDITSNDQFDAALQAMFEAALPEGDGPAKEAYDQGVTVAPVICMSLFQIETAADAEGIIDEIDDAASFADAAKEFSITAELASGCADTNSLPFATELVAADPAMGEAALVELTSTTPATRLVIRLIPYGELSDADRLEVEAPSVTEAVVRIISTAEVYVNPRLGHWDRTTMSVVSDVE